jgi:hypothetical protein
MKENADVFMKSPPDNTVASLARSAIVRKQARGR